jgi:hypothetical protein
MTNRILNTDKTADSQPKHDKLMLDNQEPADNKAFNVEHARRQANSAALEKSGTLPKLSLDPEPLDISGQQKSTQPEIKSATSKRTFLNGRIEYDEHLDANSHQNNERHSISDIPDSTSKTNSTGRALLNGLATGVYRSLADPILDLAKSPNATNDALVQTYKTTKDIGEYVAGKIRQGDYKGLSDSAASIINELKSELQAIPNKPPFEQGKLAGEALTFMLPIPPIGKIAKLEQLEKGTVEAGQLLDAIEKVQPTAEQIQLQVNKRWEMLKASERLTSESFRAQLREALDRLSPEEKEFLDRNKIPVSGVRRLQDAIEGHDSSVGLYRADKRQILIPEELRNKVDWHKNKDILYALRHEIGHAIDMNQVEHLSNEAGFVNAVNRDLKFLSREQREYLSPVFTDEDRARKEIFATAYARAKGVHSNTEFQQIVQELFSHSFKYVEGKIDDTLKQ